MIIENSTDALSMETFFVNYVRYVRTLWMACVDEDIDPLGFILYYGIFTCCRISCYSMKT